MFEPGQKVVCINDRFPIGIERFYNELPKRDVTYTIRDLVPGVSPEGGEGEVAVYLVEIRSPDNVHGIERGFNAERFAPLTCDTSESEARIGELVPAFA